MAPQRVQLAVRAPSFPRTDGADSTAASFLSDAARARQWDGESRGRGKEYRHSRGVLTVTIKPKPYKADHAP
jgi:hypothetical protein